jgi:hypothetical protein
VYLTAQRIRNRDGSEEIHSFLHFHDVPGGGGYPADPLSVPEHRPGRLIKKDTGIVALGGNSVLCYLDIIASDQDWFARTVDHWDHELESVGALMESIPPPWVVDAGDIHIVFSSQPNLVAREQYEALSDAALRLCK